MPGIGPRLWHPFYRAGPGEVAATVVNWAVADAIGLNGTTIPFDCKTGNFLVRMMGRADSAIRPLTITVKWNNIAMVQQALFADSGAGGSFVGIWSLLGQTPKKADVVFTCGAQEAGCCGIRVGELMGTPSVVKAGANLGFGYPATIGAGNAMLAVGGIADADVYPLTSTDLNAQWVGFIPPKTTLPNRTKGLSGFFGVSYVSPPDGVYDILTFKQVTGNGVIAGIEIKGGTPMPLMVQEANGDQVQTKPTWADQA